MSWSERFRAGTKLDAKLALGETAGVKFRYMPTFVQDAINAQIDALPDAPPTANVIEVYTYGHVNDPGQAPAGVGNYTVTVALVQP
jgi:hypothetical protein